MLNGLDLFTCSPRELLAELETLEPGLLAMSMLASLDRSALTPDDAVMFLMVHDRVAAWWASLQAEALVAAADPLPRVEEFPVRDADGDVMRTVAIEDAIRSEIAVGLRWSEAHAHERIATARLLNAALPSTLRALAAGQITERHAHVMADAAARLPGAGSTDPEEMAVFARAAAELEQRVLPAASRGTVPATRAAANRAVLAIDAEGQQRRRERAKARRDVWITPVEDGMSLLMALLTTEHAVAAYEQINARAHAASSVEQDDASGHVGDAVGTPGEPDVLGASIGERRAAALLALLCPAAAAAPTRTPTCAPARESSGARPGQVAARIDVVVGLDTLLGQDQEPIRVNGHDLPATALAGLADVPGLAVTIRRLLTDPVDGTVRELGKAHYVPSAALRAFLVARDQTCRFPGCNRRAARCQIDHAVPWESGGPTSAGNLGALCLRHHQLKTHAGWRITVSRDDGSCSWQSPAGRNYEREPRPALAG